MPPSQAQRTLIAQFMQITSNPSEKNAQRLLRAAGWRLETAVDSYYNSGGSAPLATRDTMKDNLATLFEEYRNPKTDEPDIAGVEGTMTYLNDLGVNLENAELLIPLEIVQAPTLGELSKPEFISGWRGVGADTLSKQMHHVEAQIRSLAVDTALFKRVYRHTFICSKEKGQKALPLENALIYWSLLFSRPGRPWKTATMDWLEIWTDFLKAKWTKSVNKDMWNQTFEFHLKTMQDETLSFWSEDGAWPGVIDDFVTYAKEKRGDSPERMETD